MSVAGPIPKVTLSTSELREQDYQAFLDALELEKQVHFMTIFPSEYDFTEACSCDECSLKIMELKDFEKELKSKKKLVTKYGLRVQYTEDDCMILSSAAQWTKGMLDLLQKNLKAVSEKSGGVPLTLKKSNSAAELEDIDSRIVKTISDSELIKGFGISDAIEADDDDDDQEETDSLHIADADKILYEIDSGLFYYEKSKVMDKACGLLQKIQAIEKEHEKAKKLAEAQKKPLDPSVSKKHIEDQIKLVKDLPVEGLLLEVEELIAKISPIDKHRNMSEKADKYIVNTCRAIIEVRREFWRRYQVRSSLTSNGNGKEHNSNGLNQTLDALLNMVNSFKNQWDEEYAPFFTSYDRSDPKRQRTEP